MSQPQFQKVQHIHRERMGGGGRCAYRGEYGPDSIPLEWLLVDSKGRKKLPQWFTGDVAEITEQALWPRPQLWHLNEFVTEGKRLGVVRYHIHGKLYDDDIVCMKAKDFEEWFL